MNIVIHWRCGHEQEYQSIGTICGNADSNHPGKGCNRLAKAQDCQVPLLPTQSNHRL